MFGMSSKNAGTAEAYVLTAGTGSESLLSFQEHLTYKVLAMDA